MSMRPPKGVTIPSVEPSRRRRRLSVDSVKKLNELFKKSMSSPLKSYISESPSICPGQRWIAGGSPEAHNIYKNAIWEGHDKSNNLPPVNFLKLPLDILIVTRIPRASSPEYSTSDPEYRSKSNRYTLIRDSTIVVTPLENKLFGIICVWVNEKSMPMLGNAKAVARRALKNAELRLKSRTHFATNYQRSDGTNYRPTQDPSDMFCGKIYNDGLVTYGIPNRKYGGVEWQTYAKRDPESTDDDIVTFASPYVMMTAAEYNAVPQIAKNRLLSAQKARIPGPFRGLPLSLCAATQVGVSIGFGVKTHADSCVKNVTESIYWANRGLKNHRFAVTSCNICIDIGLRPGILFMKGDERHGTVPPPPGSTSCGLCLISKGRCLQSFKRGHFSDMTRLELDPASRRGSPETKCNRS